MKATIADDGKYTFCNDERMSVTRARAGVPTSPSDDIVCTHMARIFLFNKPYGVICQFSRSGDRPTLKDFIAVQSVYPAGRLDTDSEGLLVLTDDGVLQARITDPRNKLKKVYVAQVEGIPGRDALAELSRPMDLGDFVTRPARIRAISEPAGLWPRDPPIRVRANIPTSWLQITISEGKNRQVRRMTAKAGHPTVRLIRTPVGRWKLAGLQPGDWREIVVGRVL
jgi:23S rRNA pseudouridine2457 synthase